ncbi:M28 family metallopeptidase [Pseudidiomarina terrestris]|uniref:M28 family peptidase n=1 Tax=Pseudidiomarina terrestris TaxID=2820060 RepID=A0AAW7QY41_9GAMM|nr:MULTISPECIES: M28 family metallopeptidase [unclassified Pseudidiomarina]MDN7123768.1 M28 family peptidase [Pseudidiomarina sp. 1APP75-32.1]MDN7126418.1 M28 family peptidase [Pseudidiomarina sp. 1APR75-33.1]MDN7135244.1 M28 family peptidase [Pseudidiomarina sp. 1ASP75-5]MDN7137917.1 M28 family peptidase [Pseudidiomarina sp. 1ASP75-14]
MKKISVLAASLLIVACSPASEPEPSTSPQMEVDPYSFNENYRDYLATLSSDEFEGRAPASKGEELTVEFVSDKFRSWGLKPFNEETGSYRQEVPLVKMTPYSVSEMTFSDSDLSAFSYKQDMMAWSPRVQEEVSLDGSEMVFAGYGIVAPEFGWNDYEGLDVAGKTVVVLVNDPGYDTGDPEVFNGKAMTYYGRWTYKFEEASRQGAAGIIVIHETGPAGYGWGVIAGGSPVRFDLARENKNMDRTEIEGWITQEAADKLFARVGSSYTEMREQAQQPDFQPVALNTAMSITVQSDFEYLNSPNLIGYIEGSKAPEEHVIYMAHWDHLGMNPISSDDQIYNGAQDNASGTAGVLALAEFYASQPQPERSVVFVLVTAEERGLLGSNWYANNPMLPLSQAVAGINMDVLNVYGPMQDMVVVGHGNSELEEYLGKYVEQQGRYVAPEPTPEAGSFYRSDHFNLAKRGVPMLYAKGGNDHVEFGVEYGKEKRAEYVQVAYHKPADEYDPEWDLRGVQQDLWLYYWIGNELANSDSWPNWYAGNEFRATRDATADQRQ